MEPRALEVAQQVRSLLERRACDPVTFRAALLEVAPLDRDAWVDAALGIEAPPDDGPELPQGCVPYLPCPVDAILRSIEQASIGASDLVVDVGSGLGRAAVLVSLLTGAAVVGVEVQTHLVEQARGLVARLGLERASFVVADASALPESAAKGSVYFLYCPFSGQRLSDFMQKMAAIAESRPLRVCSVDLPLPPCIFLPAWRVSSA